MENQQPTTPVPAPQTPAPVPTPAAPQAATPASAKPTTPLLPKSEGKSNKKLFIGCISAFGCSIFLFLGVLFAFLATGSTDNPIFGFLGVPSGEVVNVLITLVNLIFLVIVFAAFVAVIIGVFKVATARKDDKEGKRKGMVLTLAALSAMVFFIIVWVFAYFFLSSKRTVNVQTSFITEPAITTNLTAPATITFDARKVPLNTRTYNVLSHEWDFDDGTSTLRGAFQTHTYEKIGNFKAKVTITVKEKATGKEEPVVFTKDVTIQNVLAEVKIKATPEKGPAPLKVKLDGSGSKSENGEITAYAWDLDEDGQFDDSDKATAEVTFDKIGDYIVKLRITDSTGANTIGETTINATVSDLPLAVINVENLTGTVLEANKSYLFSAAQSTTPSGTIEKYSFDFGDGTKAESRTANHTYKQPGEYDITLTITDSNKKKGVLTQRFSVKAPDSVPLAVIKTTPESDDGRLSGQAPFEVSFDASGSQDANNNIVDYSWDFNGDAKRDDANATTKYTFLAAGTYNVTLTVTDSTNLSSKATMVVTVAAPGLKADVSASPVAGTVPLTVSFDASGSSYPDGTIVNYEWDFGDSKAPRTDTAKVSYQYTSIGTFTAKVTAITSDNKRATAQVLINVRPVSVKSCFEPSVDKGKGPLEVQFDPTCSTGTVVNYRWNFANLGRSSDRKPTFTFKNPGEYPVSLEVADTQNVVDTFTTKIIVQP